MGAMSDRDQGHSHRHAGRANHVKGHNRAIPGSPSQQVQVEIDELVLTGFTRSEGLGIADSLRETLGNLLAGERREGRGLESIEVDALDAGRVPLSKSGRARSTGERVARAIYRSLPK